MVIWHRFSALTGTLTARCEGGGAQVEPVCKCVCVVYKRSKLLKMVIEWIMSFFFFIIYGPNKMKACNMLEEDQSKNFTNSSSF